LLLLMMMLLLKDDLLVLGMHHGAIGRAKLESEALPVVINVIENYNLTVSDNSHSTWARRVVIR
jgi:hypothetical protein